MSHLVLLSGGIDSAVCLWEAKCKKGEVVAIHLDYGQQHREREAEAVAALTKAADVDLESIHLGASTMLFFGPMRMEPGDESPGTVPFRNPVLVSVATAYALSRGFRNVWLGTQGADTTQHPDSTKRAVRCMRNLVAAASGREVSLRTPFALWPKADIIRRGMELEVPLHLTWTCFLGGKEPCGTCAACVKRNDAIAEIENQADRESVGL